MFASHTINSDSQLLGLALVAHDVSNGAGIDTTVLQRDVGHPQGVVDSHLSAVLPNRLFSTTILDRGEMRNINSVHTQKSTLSILYAI